MRNYKMRNHQVSIGFSEELKRNLEDQAEHHQISFASIVRICCVEYLDFIKRSDNEGET